MSLIADFITETCDRNLWSEEIAVKKHEILVQRGEISTDIYLIKSGAAIITAEVEGKEQIIRLAYKNSVISTIDSFLNQKPTVYSIKSIREGKITKAGLQDLNSFFEDNQAAYSAILIELINQQNERELDLLHSSASERYKRILHRSPDVFQQIPHKYIASYLRIAPETLSRLVKS